MNVSLPQNDGSAARSAQLEGARRVYGYTYNWPPDVAVAAAVPKSDTYSPAYIAKLVPLVFELFENAVAMSGLVANAEKLAELIAAETAAVAKLSPPEVGRWFFDVHTRLADHITLEKAKSVDDYGKLFAKIPPVPVWAQHKWELDETFGWQRLAGVNPMVVQRISAVPDHVAITEAHWAKSIGRGTLEAAAKEGRLFACDYGILHGVPCGITNERQKFMHGPYAVFAAIDGKLRPVAIQIGATPDTPVFTPEDGDDWRIAKLAVQVAEASHHETVVHLGRTHMVMEACTLATRRQLADNHPLHVLLMPHCEYTLPINHSAATSLIAPGGTIDQAFGPTISACAGLVRVAIDTWPLDAASPKHNTDSRGLSIDVLPEAPYRDDGILVWDAVERFCTAYVKRWYPTAREVVEDTELQAWVRELSGPCRLAGVGTIDSVEKLAHLVTTFVFTGSAQHSAVNFTQFPYMGAVPNMAGAFWEKWPGEVQMVDVLPPPNMALLQFDTVYQLSGLRMNYLGQYPEGTFADLESQALVKELQADLLRVEAVITEREKSRWLPYPHLLPSTIPASIHI
ncbi:MAG: hypothetical protein H6737_30660 [Alphaproteobacteria bacterium]|nr:hypothetical protein [Alphaproteobacteria bacterium]